VIGETDIVQDFLSATGFSDVKIVVVFFFKENFIRFLFE
jgi:hypothetical protein